MCGAGMCVSGMPRPESSLSLEAMGLESGSASRSLNMEADIAEDEAYASANDQPNDVAVHRAERVASRDAEPIQADPRRCVQDANVMAEARAAVATAANNAPEAMGQAQAVTSGLGTSAASGASERTAVAGALAVEAVRMRQQQGGLAAAPPAQSAAAAHHADDPLADSLAAIEQVEVTGGPKLLWVTRAAAAAAASAAAAAAARDLERMCFINGAELKQELPDAPAAATHSVPAAAALRPAPSKATGSSQPNTTDAPRQACAPHAHAYNGSASVAATVAWRAARCACSERARGSA